MIELIIIMLSQYIIQIQKSQKYPFARTQSHSKHIYVRQIYQNLSQHQFTIMLGKMKVLLQVKSPFFIHLHSITQIKKRRQIIIEYQYIHHSLPSRGKMDSLNQYKIKTFQLFNILANNHIKYSPNIEEFGITEDQEPKIFINLDFSIIQDNQTDLLKHYQKIMSNIFDKPINQNKKQTQKRQTSPKNQSILLTEKIETIKNRLQNLKSLQKHQNRSNSKQVKQSNKIRYNSFNLSGQHKQFQAKNNRTSEFQNSHGQQGSQLSSSLNSNSVLRQDALSHRISTALQRTKKAMQNYKRSNNFH